MVHMHDLFNIRTEARRCACNGRSPMKKAKRRWLRMVEIEWGGPCGKSMTYLTSSLQLQTQNPCKQILVSEWVSEWVREGAVESQNMGTWTSSLPSFSGGLLKRTIRLSPYIKSWKFSVFHPWIRDQADLHFDWSIPSPCAQPAPVTSIELFSWLPDCEDQMKVSSDETPNLSKLILGSPSLLPWV